MGELYVATEEKYPYSLGCSYGFKQFLDNIINQYLCSTTTDCNSGYICDLDEYEEAFNYWLNHFGYVEKMIINKIKKVAHGEPLKGELQ